MSNVCTHPGCIDEAMQLLYPEIEIAPGEYVSGDPTREELPRTEYLCTTHAREKCFCSGCEYFVGGLEIWENPRAQRTGICDECWEELFEEILWDSDEDCERDYDY
jgi:hypothetical protein